MDFGTLLTVARKNEGDNTNQPIACYKTKFTAPKKQSKQTRSLSDNIKKFLARRDAQERQKALEEKRKRENLLALRDHKAQSRINKHLKVCKAANKSVLADAVDNENTAVTMAGPSQPDEDDYGYVSQEASAFYNQLMSKYNASTAQERPLFSSSGGKTVKDIASTKDRVKQALRQQEAEEALGHRRKRKSMVPKDVADESVMRMAESTRDQEKEETRTKPKRKLMPPPMDFTQLLKLAEKKQYEPVVIEAKPKVEEPERLMTKRQMREYAKEKDWRERKEQREKTGETISKPSPSFCVRTPKPPVGRIPKNTVERTSAPSKTPSKSSAIVGSVKKPVERLGQSSKPKTSEKEAQLEERRHLELEKQKLARNKTRDQQSEKPSKPRQMDKGKGRGLEKPITKETTKESRQKQAPVIRAARESTLPNGKQKLFPPPDVKPVRPRPKDTRRPIINKRRIYDDEEYDSDLDDFIDDGPEHESEDYSKYISEIFGYDKSKYRNNGYDDDDTAMESSFSQQLKEEYVSTKIGIMEDLEDIRMEALEKKQKALRKRNPKK